MTGDLSRAAALKLGLGALLGMKVKLPGHPEAPAALPVGKPGLYFDNRAMWFKTYEIAEYPRLTLQDLESTKFHYMQGLRRG